MLRSAAMPLITVAILAVSALLGWPLDLIQWAALIVGGLLLIVINWAYAVSPPIRQAAELR